MASANRRLGIEPGDTVGAVLDRHRGIGPGFDFVRIGLSSLIFYMHCQWLVGSLAGPATTAAMVTALPATSNGFSGYHFDWQKPIHDMLVPMFFGVSGFLVTGSAIRVRKVSTFLWFRVLRLVPALATEVALSAIVLGAFLTSLPLSSYYQSSGFFSYFLNILGLVHFSLPGVFDKNPVTIVNVNLWTLPSEFYCYLFMSVGMGLSLIYNKKWLTVAMAIATIILIPLSFITGFGTAGVFKSVAELIYYFFTGVLFFHWRDKIPLRYSLFIISFIVSFALEYIGTTTVFIGPIFICYTILFIGMMAIPRIPLLQRGDYSYGIYLYGFPICQAWLAVTPALQGHSRWLFLVAFPSTLIFAATSWHFIENPALKLKKVLSKKTISIEPKGRTVDAIGRQA